MVEDHIDPVRLEQVTRREVEAGRLPDNDKFRQSVELGIREPGRASVECGEWNDPSNWSPSVL
jgi:hypothetical protein